MDFGAKRKTPATNDSAATIKELEAIGKEIWPKFVRGYREMEPHIKELYREIVEQKLSYDDLVRRCMWWKAVATAYAKSLKKAEDQTLEHAEEFEDLFDFVNTDLMPLAMAKKKQHETIVKVRDEGTKANAEKAQEQWDELKRRAINFCVAERSFRLEKTADKLMEYEQADAALKRKHKKRTITDKVREWEPEITARIRGGR